MRISKKISKYIVLALLFIALPAQAQIGMRELGDSLMAYTGFSRLWSPTVRVKQLRVSGNNVSVRTNQTLHDFRWTEENLDRLCRKVSLWTLGHENGKVTIYAGQTDVRTLITDCARGISSRRTRARTSPSATSSSTPATASITTVTGRSGYGSVRHFGRP